MFARTFTRLSVWIRGKGEPAPLADVVVGLKMQIKRRGPGSDIAAAKLEGIRLAQVAYRR